MFHFFIASCAILALGQTNPLWLHLKPVRVVDLYYTIYIYIHGEFLLIHLENQADLGRCHSTFPPNKWRDCNEFWRLMNAICKRHMPPTFTLLFLALKSWNQELEGIYHFIRFRLVSKIWGKWWENVSIFSQKLFDCFCKLVATGTRSDNLNDTLPLTAC